MPYQFPPDVDIQIKAHIASGMYSSEDDVLRGALQALQRHNEEVAAVQEGIDDLEAGRARPLREFDVEFRRRKNIPQDS